ncbi:MAG: hypothetical protein ABIN36_12925 [Ferruginibacter sp.]
MRCIPHILNTTGIWPEILADYVGLSRQALLKASDGFINPTAEMHIKLSRLQQCIEQTSGYEHEATGTGHLTDQETAQERNCRYRALVLQRKLDKYENIQKKYRLFLRALELFQPVDEEESLWKQKSKSKIIKKLDKCSEATCMRLRKRVYLLTAEADYISKLQCQAHAK